MKVWAQFDGEGRKIGGFWDDFSYPDVAIPAEQDGGVETYERHPDIPADAIEITEEDRQTLMSAIDGWCWDRGIGALVACQPRPIPLPEGAKPSLGRSIRDWQFYSVLALEGVITDDEAIATSSGALPKLLTDAIAAAVTDPKARLVATMKVRNTTDFHRNDEMVALVAAYLTRLGSHGVWDDARLDALWVDGEKLT